MAIEPLHSAKTDIGRKRPHNEDSFLADRTLGLYIVCDGMGGGNAGEVASRMAIDTIHAYMKEAGSGGKSADQVDPNLSQAANQLANAIRVANETIHKASWNSPKYAGMGTTVVAALLSDNYLSIAHVGDSRLYMHRNGALQALTDDHSWVAEQVAQGFMSEEEAERSPKRNIVTRALGIESTVQIDVTEVPVFKGDQLLLCSDGLTRGVRSPEILQILTQREDLAAKTDQLIALANEAGGDDNITVLLVSIQGNATRRFWDRLRERWFLEAS